MLTTTICATGLILTASTIPWSAVMKGITIAWELFGVFRGKAPEPTVEILLEAIVSVIGDRQRLPHVDLFCEVAGWSRDKTWTEKEVLLGIEKLIAGYVLAGDVRLALTEIFNEIEHLTTEYIRSSSQLTHLLEKIGGSEGTNVDYTLMVGLFPYWSSLGGNDQQALLERYQVDSFVGLVAHGVTPDSLTDKDEHPVDKQSRVHDLLHRWLASRSATVKLVCKADRLVVT